MLRLLVARDLKVRYVRSTNVPRVVWVLHVVLSKGSEYLFALPVLALFAILYAKRPKIQILSMPLAIVMTLILLTGIGLILAPLTVLVRDTERIIPVLLRVMFYFSPILYSVHNIPNRRRHRSFRALVIKGHTGAQSGEFWPVRHVSFDIAQSEAIGVVGRNGQGKSTLLSLIAGVLLAQLQRFCTRGLYLAGGALRGDGPLDEILRQYDVASGTVAPTLSSLDDAASAAG